MEVKHFIFFALLLFGVPSAVVFLRLKEKFVKWTVCAMVFMIPFVYSTGINFYPDKFYRGTARGFEVLAADLLALTVACFLISRWGFKNFKIFPAGSLFYVLYFLFACISTVNSENLMYSGFELLKMVMMYLYFVAIYNYIIRYGDLQSVLFTFLVLLIFNFGYMLTQKYLFFVYQPSGIFPHRNGAAMFANMIAPIFLSIMFNAKLPPKKFWIFSVGYSVAAMLVVVALSRGALIFFPLAALIVTAVTFGLGGSSEKKLKIFLALGCIAILGILKAAPMVIERFEHAPKSSAEGRVQLAKAALNMANDKFFGVGVNNWGIKINPPYNYTEGTGMERPNENYKSGLVETIYLLVAAECGWIGFSALICWMYYYFFQNIANIFKYRKTSVWYMPVGIFGGMVAVYGQSCLEWVLKQPTNFYQLMIIFAIIAAMIDTRKKLSKLNS